MTTPLAQADALTSAVGVRRLDDTVVVRVAGDDRRVWLNGQITNDVRATQRGDSVYALVLTPHGKILADLFALDRGDDLALTLPRSAADTVLARLDKYVIMEDVELTRLVDVAVLTAQGPSARTAVTQAAITAARIFPCDRLGTGGFDILVPSADADAMFAVLRAAAERLGGVVVDDEGWTLAGLRGGRPRFGVDFGEHQYPQEAGLRERALSFGKGCYLGQEIVCTLESRGQLVRKLVLLDAAGAPAPATAVTLADGTEIGTVTSSMLDPATGRALAFAYVKRAHAVVGVSARTGGVEATISRVLATESS